MTIKHLESSLKIASCINCVNCPARLYTKTTNVILGFGNLYSNKVIVLPTYSLDYKGKGTYINTASILINIIGDRIFEDYYVTREIKCYSNSEYEIDEVCKRYCSIFLNKELFTTKAKHLFAFGDVDLGYVRPSILNKFHVHRMFNPYCTIVGNDYVKGMFEKQIAKMIST